MFTGMGAPVGQIMGDVLETALGSCWDPQTASLPAARIAQGYSQTPQA